MQFSKLLLYELLTFKNRDKTETETHSHILLNNGIYFSA